MLTSSCFLKKNWEREKEVRKKKRKVALLAKSESGSKSRQHFKMFTSQKQKPPHLTPEEKKDISTFVWKNEVQIETYITSEQPTWRFEQGRLRRFLEKRHFAKESTVLSKIKNHEKISLSMIKDCFQEEDRFETLFLRRSDLLKRDENFFYFSIKSFWRSFVKSMKISYSFFHCFTANFWWKFITNDHFRF